MQFIIDTADFAEIKRINRIFPVDGVTTNPKIIAKETKDLLTVIKGIREIIGKEKSLHIQILSETSKQMVEEAERIVMKAGESTFIKVPVTEEGIQAIPILKSKGIRITATAVYTPLQALVAAKSGADYVAPYITRTDNIGGDGVALATDIDAMLKNYRLPCRVLGASFATVAQITALALSGVEAVTLPPELFYKMIRHPMTEEAVAEFIRLGKPYYNI